MHKTQHKPSTKSNSKHHTNSHTKPCTKSHTKSHTKPSTKSQSFILIHFLPITPFQMLNFYQSLHSKIGLKGSLRPFTRSCEPLSQSLSWLSRSSKNKKKIVLLFTVISYYLKNMRICKISLKTVDYHCSSKA